MESLTNLTSKGVCVCMSKCEFWMFCRQLNVMSLFFFSSYLYLQDVFLHKDVNGAGWKSVFHIHNLMNLHDTVGGIQCLSFSADLCVYFIMQVQPFGATYSIVK